MIHSIQLKVLPSEAALPDIIKRQAAQALGVKLQSITGYNLLRRSIDARSRQVYFLLQLQIFVDEPMQPMQQWQPEYRDVRQAKHEVVVVGAGPAGLFAALQLVELGIRPIVIERGKDVRARRRDLALLNKTGEVNPESNYCFGEGGAGTYSDGKLYTRSNKRGDIHRILQIFRYFGAEEKITIDAHPHIGTNKLPHIITAMRDQVIASGGEVRFDTKLTDLITDRGVITGVKLGNGDTLPCKHVILATGHSARDIYELLHHKGIAIEAKPFALGVRIEHPQSLIDSIQYKCDSRGEYLPPASYGLVEQVLGKGVFSFCMCPGGIIAPAATDPGELVVNGWSPSKRDNPFANSGMVVSIDEENYKTFSKYGPLAAMYYQREVERKAFAVGGGKFVAPAQRMTDFSQRKVSASLPDCSYIPGVRSAALEEVLPEAVYERLAKGFIAFGKKMKGYYTSDAIVVATESRTSAPVRIPRDKDTFQHPEITGLYPCAEGAGYAGGIVSAAMDGENIARSIALQLQII
jgi:uncharacterized FAD-dependent dehydrogenase